MLPAPLLLVLAVGPSVTSLDNAAPLPLAEDANDPWKRLKVSADARLRAEGTLDQTNGEDRWRGRFRFRLSADYQVADGLKAGSRFTTLSDGRDANNPHWDFGDADGFSASEVGIDRLFLEWQPQSSWTLTGGKFGHVFTRPSPFREFAWDDDVQPAGVAAVWSPKTDGAVSFDLRAIYAVAAEVNSLNGSGVDPAVFGGQANVNFKASETTSIHVATSYSDWSSLRNFTSDQGNTGDEFAIWDTYAMVTLSGEGFSRITAFGQYFDNLDDDSGEDTGYVAGVQLGRTKGKGNWNVFGGYYDLDANSVFSSVAQDDTPIPGTGLGTGMSGFVAGTQCFVLDNVSLKLWVLTSDADASEDPYRIRFDIAVRIP
jgi:hypothetical protein